MENDNKFLTVDAIDENEAMSWCFDRKCTRAEGVVLYCDDKYAFVVRVESADPYSTYANDSGKTVSDEHKHSVRLNDCPPPFSNLCGNEKGGCYAVASPDDVELFSDFRFGSTKSIRMYDGSLLSERDRYDILHHIFPDGVDLERGWAQIREKHEAKAAARQADRERMMLDAFGGTIAANGMQEAAKVSVDRFGRR